MDVTRPREISELLQRYGASVRKSWGQNFLINKAAVGQILASAELAETDTVVEVGPGLGVMTAPLLEAAGKVVAIEIDPLLCRVLEDRFRSALNFTLVHGDALAQNFLDLVPGSYIVLANLPYYITSPFLVKLLEQRNPPQRAVFLVQWEVARRLTAKPGTSEYSSLTVLVQYYCQTELLFKVNPGSFYPPPKVDSGVVRLRWRPPLRRPKDENLMFRIVRTAFGQRRKMLKGLLAREFGLETGVVARLLVQAGLDGDTRGERLSAWDYAALADIMEVAME